MTGPPAAKPVTIADKSARLEPQNCVGVPIRLDGQLLKRVAPADAEQLVKLGWAEWARTGRRRYLRLTSSAPLSTITGWRGDDGTRAAKADGTLRMTAGQRLGDTRSTREFVPLSKF